MGSVRKGYLHNGRYCAVKSHREMAALASPLPPFYFSFYKSKHKLESLTYISEYHKTPFGRQLFHTEEKALCQVQKLIKNA